MQVLGSRIELTRIGRMLQAIIVFIYAIIQNDIHWTPLKILTLVLMMVGGCGVFTGIFIIYAALCFFTTEGLEFMNVLTDGAREYGKYPVSVYGKRVLQFCTYIVPFALIQYYPLLYLLDREAPAGTPVYPLLAGAFLIPCILFWKFGIAHYKSTGS